MKSLPAKVLRTIALHAQSLDGINDKRNEPDQEQLLQLVDRLGCVQIDTLHMVRRSHYLVPWSRLGSYRPESLDELMFGNERRLFEGWQHAASIIPLQEYRFQMPRQRDLREHPTSWYNRWLNEQVHKDIVPQVMDRIRREGALKVSDFKSDGNHRGSWWNWRPAKFALEFLYAFGELMIANRVHFQRMYDLTERILPGWVDTTEPTVKERDRFWVERGVKALGICLPRHAGDYTWMKVGRSKPIVAELIAEGVLRCVSGKIETGQEEELVIHRDDFDLIEQVRDGEISAQRTTLLSPFDNLFWAARRDEMFWGFHQALECYLPAPKRIYGYFCLPILHKDRLVGRLDPKMDRKSGTLLIKAMYLEPGVKPAASLVEGVANCLQDFMRFNNARDVKIEFSQPQEFGQKLAQKLH